mmetsp:Transcript_79221/g.246700  ORF Transcript_79221/g.246700 Transcript_79221/m.246700 type:complete len:201 (+) Transcript_79221:243-845(+)
MGMQRAFGGAWSGPSASGCGPSAISTSGPSSGVPAPNASKMPPQAAWESSLPVSPRRSPSAPSIRASQPKSGLSPVRTVPMLARTTCRPALRAPLTSESGSASSCPCSRSSAWWNLCPAALQAPCSSNSAPTASKRTSASLYALANSGVMGSCKSSHVVTRTRVLSSMPCALPKGSQKLPALTLRPYSAAIRRVHARSGS